MIKRNIHSFKSNNNNNSMGYGEQKKTQKEKASQNK